MSDASQRLRQILQRNRVALGLDLSNISENNEIESSNEADNFEDSEGFRSFNLTVNNSPDVQDELINLLDNLSLNNDSPNMESLRFHTTLLPNFSGNQDHLESFILSIDEFYSLYSTNGEAQKKLVLAAIKSKLVDDAKNFLLSRPDLIDWTPIKEALRQKFGDPITYPILMQQLQYVRINKNEGLLEFVDRLKTFVQRIISKIQCEVADQNSKILLVNQIEKTAVMILTANSPQTLKTMLMLQCPDKINDALTHVLNYNMIESQVNFSNNNFQQYNKYSQIQNPIQKKFNATHKNSSNSVNRPPTDISHPQINYLLPAQQTFPSQPIFVNPRPVQRNYPTNSQVFGNQAKTQQFNRPPPRQDALVPMSISTAGPSRMTQQRQPPFKYPSLFQPSGPPNFTSQELSNVETQPELPIYNPYDVEQSTMTHYEEYPQYEEESYNPEEYTNIQDFTPNNAQNLENKQENFSIQASNAALT